MIKRVTCTAAAVMIATSPAWAGPGEDALSGIARCASITDTNARLGCFDVLAARLKLPAPLAAAPAPAPAVPPVAAAPAAPPVVAAPALAVPPPAPAVAQAVPAAQMPEATAWYDPSGWFGSENVSPVSQVRPEQFGSENLPAPSPKPGEAPRPEPLDHITVEVTDVAFNPVGRFTVFLANGQIWQQLQGDGQRAHFPSRGPYAVTITRGLIGSYNLSIGNQNRIYKVRRIK